MSINDGIYPICIQWEFNAGPTSNATAIAVWISLVWVDRYHEKQKNDLISLGCCERVAYIGFFPFFIMKTRIL